MRTFVQRQSQCHEQASSGGKAHTTIATSTPVDFLQTRPSINEANRRVYDFSEVAIYPSAPTSVQAKLAVGSPSDSCEQEADRVSEQVVRMVEPPVQRSDARSAVCLGDPMHQPESRPQREQLQMSSVGSGALGQTAAPPVVGEVLRSPGQPLDSETRAFMEPRFGYDLSQVRIHTDGQAAESSRALHAQAYAVGSDIVFAAGHYAPGTSSGMGLLAHELTHVVQQMRGTSPVVRRAPVMDALKKYTTAQKVWDSDAKAIDLAISQSPNIAKYVPAEKLKKASGHVEGVDKGLFDTQYTTYATALGESTDEIKKDLTKVGGFTDRKAGKIHLLNHVADVESLLHEAIHLSSSAQFQSNFGHYLNEGVTEHFTEAVLNEQQLKPGQAYRDELAMARGLISDLGEQLVGEAYFQGKMGAYQRVAEAFSHGTDRSAFQTWQRRINSSDHKDWQDATQQLHAIMSQP
jgi:Domain of unknown function (DUF4157)